MEFENEIKKTQVKSDKLGIKSGLTQEQFNQAIIDALETKFSANGSANLQTISSAADITTTAGKNMVKTLFFEPTPADLKTEMKDDNISFTYSLAETLKSVPKEALIRKVSVVASGKKTVLLNSDKNAMTIAAPPSEFPVFLDISINGSTSDGSFVLRGTKQINAEDSVSVLHFNNTPEQAKPVETQEDFNKKVLEEITFLKRNIS
jgi:hypothetical protein